MQYEIRAMSLGEILDTGFRLLRDHFVLFTGIGLMIYVPMALMNAAFRAAIQPKPADSAVFLGLAGFGFAVLWLLLWPLGSAAITYAIGEIYVGRNADFAGAVRTSAGLFMPLVGTMFLSGLATAGGFLLLIIPGLYLVLCFMLMNQVIVLEGQSGVAALRRSRELMRGNLLRGFLISLVVWILSFVLGAAVGILMHLAPAILPVGSALVQAIAFAYGSAVMVVLYFEIRCRKEAFDLEHLAQVVEAQPSEVAVPAR